MTEPNNEAKKSEEKNNETKNIKVWALAGELGYTIAIPIVFFALAGRFADRTFGTTPWLLIVGILISIFASTYLIYRKMRDIMNG